METNIEELARKRVEARTGLAVHLSMYVVMNVGLALIWYLTGAGYPWFVWPMLGWGIGILAHAISFWVGPGSDVERRAVERETERLRHATR